MMTFLEWDSVLIVDIACRLADKQAKPCLLACLLVLAGSKQASKRPYFGQSSKQKEGLLACLLVYCLYIVNLVVAVVGNRPLVF
jgi:hypothetical protein